MRLWPVAYHDFGVLVRASDLSATLLASTIAAALYHWSVFGTIGPILKFSVFGSLYAALLLPCLAARGMYELSAIDSPASRSTILIGSALVLLFLTLVLSSLGPNLPLQAGPTVLLSAIAPSLIIIQRALLSHILARGLSEGRFSGRAIVLVKENTSGPTRQTFDYAQFGYHVVQSVLVPSRAEIANAQATWSACAQQVAEHVRESKIDEVHVALDWTRWEDVSALVAELQTAPVPVLLVADTAAQEVVRLPHMRLGTRVAFELKPPPLTRVEWVQKRIFDVVIATISLIVCLPVLAIIALAIRLDSPGPVLFRQTRGGFNGRPFRIYKFRTMTVLEDGAAVAQARCNDPRVTRVGRWLRRKSLDELPQLLNVIKGEMSLVGPRPHALSHDREFSALIPNYALRTHTMPGITGWAQVHGLRGETATVELIRRRVDFDIQYIANRTLLLDVLILIRTIHEVWRHPNAY